MNRSAANMTKPKPNKLCIEVIECQQGIKMSLETMSVDTTPAPGPKPINMEIKEVEIQFKKPGGKSGPRKCPPWKDNLQCI